MKIDTALKARRDIDRIGSYIRNKLYNPTAANKIVNKIYEKIDRIAEFPGKGVPIGPLLGIDIHYRFAVCGNYKIFYRHEADTIYIDRVLHNKQDYMKVLFDNKKVHKPFG